jgi:two-component system, chemotaxis family, sensor kinase CheA
VDTRTHREFMAEIEELIEQLFADIESLRLHEGRGPLRSELLARIFRCVHSVKGVAASAGFDDISALAHHTESLLDSARAGRTRVDDALVDTLEEAANAISENLGAAAAGVVQEIPDEIVRRIDDLIARPAASDSAFPLPDLPAEIGKALNDREEQLIDAALRQDAKLYLVGANFDIGVFDSEFHALRDALTQHGEVIATIPQADNSQPGRIVFKLVYSSDLELAEISRYHAASSEVTITELSVMPTTAGATVDETPPHQHGNQWGVTAPFISNSVRVDLEELDQLTQSSHEIFSQAVAALDQVSSTLPPDASVELRNLDAQIRQSLTALEEQIIQLRMVSVDRVIQRAIRAGRVAARLAGKEIEFTSEGCNLRLDKVFFDALANPLLHLVRNAVDHGIESPAERIRAGKNARGNVRITANSIGGRATIAVSDDGRGIDPLVISSAAAKLGLLDDRSTLDDEQSLRMIFRPGFSTAAAVSTVSGRGVGLDVVERSVEQVGGALRVRNEPGKGVRFEIRLPASFASMRSLIFTSAGHRYCVDTQQVIGRIEIDPREITRGDQGEALRWHDELLRVTSMRRVLGQSFRARKDKLQVLICEIEIQSNEDPNTRQRQALIVDEIGDTQEVLVRSLGRHAARWQGVVGAAELRDGSVALALDLPALLDSFRLIEPMPPQPNVR